MIKYKTRIMPTLCETKLTNYFKPVLYTVLLLLLHTLTTYSLEVTQEFCPVIKPDNYIPSDGGSCQDARKPLKRAKYILYDVNPPEGFNLRRDVYMRMAVFARKLKKKGDWHLVLPPWGRLYHWQSRDIGTQELLPWSLFFDIPSLETFAPVMDMHEFLKEYNSTSLDEVYVLQHYKDGWENDNWEEKFSIEPCQGNIPYDALEDGSHSGWFWGYSNMTASSVQCLSFHGHASQLSNVAERTTARTVMFDHAEIALHDTYGDRLYWMARRSMRFTPRLVQLAMEFRKEKLNSTDKADGTERPVDWRDEKPHSNTTGAPFVCVHLRRKDFLWGRSKDVPSLAGAARQIRVRLRLLNLHTVFVATDAPADEFRELQNLLPEFTVLRYEPSPIVRRVHKDGGVAIIEQIICSHARFFIGTHESTFSFRIQEEREILGFPPETTFNRLCGDSDAKCLPPSKWRIVF